VYGKRRYRISFSDEEGYFNDHRELHGEEWQIVVSYRHKKNSALCGVFSILRFVM